MNAIERTKGERKEMQLEEGGSSGRTRSDANTREEREGLAGDDVKRKIHERTKALKTHGALVRVQVLFGLVVSSHL